MNGSHTRSSECSTSSWSRRACRRSTTRWSLPAQPRPGRDPAGRRPRGDRRVAHDRRVHRLLRIPADADLADADARLHARRGAARDRLRGPDLPGARPRAADTCRLPTHPRCPPATVVSMLRDAGLTFGGEPAGAARDRPRHRRRPDGRAGRRDGLGQDGAGVAAAAAVRRRAGLGRDRRRRRALGRPVSLRPRSRSSTTIRSCSPRPCTTTSPTRAPTRPARRSRRRP